MMVADNARRGMEVSYMDFNAVNNSVLVTDENDDVVRVLSLDSNSTTATITLGNGNRHIAGADDPKPHENPVGHIEMPSLDGNGTDHAPDDQQKARGRDQFPGSEFIHQRAGSQGTKTIHDRPHCKDRCRTAATPPKFMEDVHIERRK